MTYEASGARDQDTRLAPGCHFSPAGGSDSRPRRSAHHDTSKDAPKGVRTSASVHVARITLIAADGTSETIAWDADDVIRSWIDWRANTEPHDGRSNPMR